MTARFSAVPAPWPRYPVSTYSEVSAVSLYARRSDHGDKAAQPITVPSSVRFEPAPLLGRRLGFGIEGGRRRQDGLIVDVGDRIQIGRLAQAYLHRFDQAFTVSWAGRGNAGLCHRLQTAPPRSGQRLTRTRAGHCSLPMLRATPLDRPARSPGCSRTDRPSSAPAGSCRRRRTRRAHARASAGFHGARLSSIGLKRMKRSAARIWLSSRGAISLPGPRYCRAGSRAGITMSGSIPVPLMERPEGVK